MIRVLCLTLCTLALAAPFAAADDTHEDGCCPVAKKIDTLLTEWQTAQTEWNALPETDRQAIATRLGTLAQQCPIGSRVGPTFVDLQAVLATLVAGDEECAKHCPIAAIVEKGGPDAEACQDAIMLKTAHTQILKNLYTLTTYATTTLGMTAKGDADLTTRVTALKTTWEKAGPEFAALAPEKQEELGKGIMELCKTNKSVALIVPTLVAIADGFDALIAIDAKMGEWAEANPQFFKDMDMPAEAMEAFEARMALVQSTSEALHLVRDTVGEECCEEEGDTEEAGS